MSDYKHISDYFTLESGIASHMEFDFLYASKEEIDALIYVTFGERNPSPVVLNLLSSPPTDTELDKIAKLALALYMKKWEREKTAFAIEYDPLHNYEDVYSESSSGVKTKNGSEDRDISGRNTSTDNNTRNRTDDLSTTESTTSSNKIDVTDDGNSYGFNSTASVPIDSNIKSNVSSGSSSDALSNTGTQEIIDSGTGSETISTHNGLSVSSMTNDTGGKTSTHKGNIGNLTTQQLFKQEIDLCKWVFVKSVIEDLKDFLTIPVYCS